MLGSPSAGACCYCMLMCLCLYHPLSSIPASCHPPPRPATDKLSVSRNSDAAGVASALLKALLRGRSVAVKAAGPAAVATATRAIQLAREGALEAGYEVGVWPSYVKQTSGDTEVSLGQAAAGVLKGRGRGSMSSKQRRLARVHGGGVAQLCEASGTEVRQ
jgi:stage V sporulation protein SpoVS